MEHNQILQSVVSALSLESINPYLALRSIIRKLNHISHKHLQSFINFCVVSCILNTCNRTHQGTIKLLTNVVHKDILPLNSLIGNSLALLIRHRIHVCLELLNIVTHDRQNNVLSKEVASLFKAFLISYFKFTKHSHFFKHHIESVLISIHIFKASIITRFCSIIRHIVESVEHLSHHKASMKLSVLYITIFDNLFGNCVFLNNLRYIVYIAIDYNMNLCASRNIFVDIQGKVLIGVNTCLVKFIHSFIFVQHNTFSFSIN